MSQVVHVVIRTRTGEVAAEGDVTITDAFAHFAEGMSSLRNQIDRMRMDARGRYAHAIELNILERADPVPTPVAPTIKEQVTAAMSQDNGDAGDGSGGEKKAPKKAAKKQASKQDKKPSSKERRSAKKSPKKRS